MKKGKQLYEGKAKKIFETDKPEILLVSYKDDATAFNGIKKGTILGKGIINNKVTNYMMRLLEKAGIPTHYIEEISERETLVKKVSIIPLEVIIRNVSAGSFAKNYGVEEGIIFDEPTIEFSYKNDNLGDPLINSYHAIALKLATKEEIEILQPDYIIWCAGEKPMGKILEKKNGIEMLHPAAGRYIHRNNEELGFEGNVEKWENYYRELEESQKGAEYLKVSKGVEKYIRVFKSRVEKFNNKNKISC